MLGVILNRLLGANQSKATRLIGALLSDINDPDELSTGESVVRWVCPQTGTQSTTSIQHVIDFDFYHGGGNRRPRNFKIDDTFYRDPKSAPELTPNSPRSISPPVVRQTKHRRVAACANAAASTNGQGSAPRIRLDEWLRDDESDDNNIGSSEKDKPPPPKRRRAAVDHAVEAMTVAAVADGTVLLRYCVEHLHGSANQLRLLSESYIIPAAAPPDRHGARILPNALATSYPSYDYSTETSRLGSADFVELALSALATKFQPHPVILGRLFDFQFGVRGLSVLHFKRFNTAARRKWRQEGRVNMSNFSTNVDLPKLPNEATLSDLHECFMVLSMYAEVIFDYHAQRIVSHARSFRDELEDYEGWTPEDIRSVVFWFDFIFEEFRRSAADGISTGVCFRAEVLQRLTLKDHELQGLLYSLQSTKIAAFGSSGERINNQDLTRYVSASQRVCMDVTSSAGTDIHAFDPPPTSLRRPLESTTTLCA
ncbi:uncharacterized protein KRP23_14263 [Phytophthora ramorum]|uniref:uncharacterized protein n=1 Tax=Phytophthora ramorum TaxID=164328 RepID=UPI00309B34ED|nr:hypothetical protein KRP23_14263 [Phytophthora ramorum]